MSAQNTVYRELRELAEAYDGAASKFEAWAAETDTPKRVHDGYARDAKKFRAVADRFKELAEQEKQS